MKFKSVKEDEKDGDIDAKVKIAPNTNQKDITIKVESKELAPGPNQQKLGILKSEEISDRNGSLKRSDSKLAAGIGPFPGGLGRSDFAPHHIISISCTRDSVLMKAASESGYNINRGSNGIWLPNKADVARIVKLPTHTGRHLKKYFTTVSLILSQTENRAKKSKIRNKAWSETVLLNNISNAESLLRNRLINLEDPLKLQKDDPLKPADPNPDEPTF